jgi:AraC-like DNA-binding protein/mannose-6-phosphate isomerase-like protein (cupin superfamily)
MFTKHYYESLKAEFVRKVKIILDELEQFDKEELFSLRCYELRDDADALRRYINSCPDDEAKTLFLIHYRLIIDNDPIKLRENSIFNRYSRPKDRNVFITKHTRYSPVFQHCHDYFETFFVLTGQCTNIIADKRIPMAAGQICFIAPNTCHSLEVFDDSIIMNIIIRKSTFDEIFFNLLTTNDILSQFFLGNLCLAHPVKYINFDIGNDQEMMECFFTLLVEQGGGGDDKYDSHSERIMDDLISIFFSLLVRKYGNRPLAYEQSNAIGEFHWNIITHIYNNFRTVTLTKTSAYFNLSVTHCSRLINTITGKNFTSLVRDIRMKKARTLLSSSNSRIYDIAYFLGYENQETFIRTFKKYYGITPTQYRQNHSTDFRGRPGMDFTQIR